MRAAVGDLANVADYRVDRTVAVSLGDRVICSVEVAAMPQHGGAELPKVRFGGEGDVPRDVLDGPLAAQTPHSELLLGQPDDEVCEASVLAGDRTVQRFGIHEPGH